MDANLASATLDKSLFKQSLAELSARDPALAGVIEKWGNPPFWVHSPGFSGLVLAILSQQVSLESANATFSKLEVRLGSLDPESFLTLDGETLQEVGFSRQKASYVQELSSALVNNVLDLGMLTSMGDEKAREVLMGIRGVGSWTANTYLLFALRRADAWPSGDLALAKAIQELYRLDSTPTWDKVDQYAKAWRPWRAVAARILWHHYLSVRGRA
jgi:DNA-3-methyladenine glycosylase II